ncbi:hypothetical protein ACFCXH_00770 [Streptomyces nojiriensis]|uniref:hypothetical protein n=1 Tax=Streptomyces nojiriensis TaxID=66374 RepID=UPI0035DB9D06
MQQYGWCTSALHGAERYQEFCRAAGLPPLPDGYGLLLVIDEYGQRHTLATTDVLYLSLLHHGLHDHGPVEISFPLGKFTHVTDDWLEIPSAPS